MRADAQETGEKEQAGTPRSQITVAIDILRRTPSYRDEYDVFVGGMVYGNVATCPSFDDGLRAIETLLALW